MVTRSSAAGTTAVRQADLPDDLVLSNYFSVRDGKIVSLVVIFNRPAEY